MRWKSRIEGMRDSRFMTAQGVFFEVKPCRFFVTNQLAGPEAELRLAVVVMKSRRSSGNTTRLASLCAWNMMLGPGQQCEPLRLPQNRRDRHVGNALFSESGVPFSTNSLKMHVSSNSLSLVYNGVTRFTTNSRGLDVNAWPDGAVCAVEVESISGRTEFVYLDNMKAWRDNIVPVTFYEGSFTNAPDGMMVRSWMGDAAVYLNWSVARDTATYVTNGRVMLLPGDNNGEKSWLNARKDFQNDLRLV
jgi:hypothetical protein